MIMDSILFYSFLFFYFNMSLTREEHSPCISDACCELWDDKTKQCKACSPGFLGWNCSEICPFPNYGRDCQEMCNCEERRCDVATGCNPYNDGCRSGYFGNRCVYKCIYPNYGKGCQSFCSCAEENCNYIIGCVKPETTSLTRVTPTENTETMMEKSGALPLFVVFLVSAIFVSIIIALIVWQVRKPKIHISNVSFFENTHKCANQSDHPGCVGNDARPSHLYSCEIPVRPIETGDYEQDFIMHRESSASTTVYDLGSVAYEDMGFIVESTENTSR